MWSVAPTTTATDRAVGRTARAPGGLPIVQAGKSTTPIQLAQGVGKKFMPPTAVGPRPGAAAGLNGIGGAKGLAQRLANPTLPMGCRLQHGGIGQGEGNEVADFLKELGLSQYTEAVLANGFDEMDTLLHIEDSDMKEIGISACHVVKLRRRLQELRQGVEGLDLDDSNPMVAFLKDIGLSQYAEALLQSGFDELETLMDIQDDDMKDLGIPRGHVVKLKRCLREIPASQGYTPQPTPMKAYRVPAARRVAAPVARAVYEHSIPNDQMKTDVERSWERVQAIGADTVGEMLYRHTFAIDPAVMVLFRTEVRSKYRDWTADEGGSDESNVYQSAALRKLFSKFVNAIGCTVAGLHDFGRLVPMLTQLGARHAGYGLKEGNWPTLGKALILTLRDCLGSDFTGEVEAAWTMVYGFMSNIMIEGLRGALADKSHEGTFGALDDDKWSDHSTGLPSEGDDARKDWNRQSSGATETSLGEEIVLQDWKKDPEGEASAAA